MAHGSKLVPATQLVQQPASILRLLGGFELRVGLKPVRLPGSAQRVLAYLALNEGLHPRARVAGSLWSEASEGRAHASLRSAIWRIRRVSPSTLVSAEDRLGVSPDVSVDSRELALLAHRATEHSVIRDTDSVQMLLGVGELLPGWYEDWVLFEREQLHQLRLHALESVCAQLVAARHFPRAVEVGLAAVAMDPMRESAHIALAKAFLAEGNRREAILDFRHFRTLLGSDLGIDPSSSFASLVGERTATPERVYSGFEGDGLQ